MSLVSTWVRAVDGKLYRDPVFRGDGWFLCFDDDDPPELVVRAGQKPPHLPYFKRKRRGNSGMRCFTGEISGGFEDANSYFGRITQRIPVPTEHGGCVSDAKEIGQGCLYDFPKKKPR
jgi:hypothetical protein